MTGEVTFVFALIAAAAVLMASNRARFDVVALLVVLALMSTPVVTLVVEPGRYKFMDFVKVGIPLVLLTYLVTMLVAPLIFPYHPSP